MIRSLEKLNGYNIIAEDDDIGKVKDFYLDSNELIIRYIVVDTGGWLRGRKVVISPESIKNINPDEKEVYVSLTKEEIEDSPSIDEKKPVSRQDEVKLADHYDWSAYWAPVGGTFSGTAFPVRPTPLVLDVDNPIDPSEEKEENESVCQEDENCYLRSTREIDGYTIHARNGEIGHLEDVLIDDETWLVNYLVIDTRNWLPGKDVILAPEWLDRISYTKKEVYVDLFKEAIKNSPEYDPEKHIDRDYEEELYEHYDQPKYWEENK